MEQRGEDPYECYRQAEELYQGELLSANSTENWVIVESLRFKRMYEKAVSWLGDYLKVQKDYPGMYRLYRQAAQVYPFDGWQTGQIESMIFMGNTRKLSASMIRQPEDIPRRWDCLLLIRCWNATGR